VAISQPKEIRLTAFFNTHRRYHNYALFVRPTAGSTSDIEIFHQLGSGVPVNPFAKSELLY
jgi:hypothetical protein